MEYNLIMKKYYNVYLTHKKELTEHIVYASTPVEAKKIFGKLQELKDWPGLTAVEVKK